MTILSRGHDDDNPDPIIFMPGLSGEDREHVSLHSRISLAGFNLIQLFTILHAYIHKDFLLFIGYLAAFITCGAVTVLIILYKDKTS